MGDAGEQGGDWIAGAIRRGGDLHLTLDFPPEAAPTDAQPRALLLSGEGDAAALEVPLRWEAEDRLGAHVTLPGTGTWHPVIQVGGRAIRAPPVTLPYSPEFEPGSVEEGRTTLSRLARLTGGRERLSMAGIFADAGRSSSVWPLAPLLVAIAVVLLLAEVFVRRFLSGRPQHVVTLEDPALRGVLEASRAPSVSADASSPAIEPPPVPARPAVQDALAQARERARRRTGG